MYFNKIQLTGNLGSDARSFPPIKENGKFMISFSVAHSKPPRRSDGAKGSEKVSETVWFDCKGYYDEKAHAQLAPRLVKGAHVFVEGPLEFEKRVVEGVDRTYNVIYLREMQILDKPMHADDSAPKSAASLPAARAEETHSGAFQPANF